MKNDLKAEVPISEKLAWTISETAKISNIGENKLYELVKNPRCPFVLYVGNKRLIKKKEFLKFISDAVEI